MRSRASRASRLRIGAATAAVAALTFSLAACGGDSSDGDSLDADGDVDGTGKTLTVWIMQGTNRDADDYFDDVSTAFKEETGADLDIQKVQWADAHDQFTQASPAAPPRTSPRSAPPGRAEFADAGALMDVTDQVDADGLRRRPRRRASSRPAPSTASSTACRGTPASARSSTAPTSSRRLGLEPPDHLGRASSTVADTIKAAEPDMITVPGPRRRRVRALPVGLGRRRRDGHRRTATPGPRPSTRRRPRRASTSTPTSPSSTASRPRPPPPGTRPTSATRSPRATWR